MAFFLVMFVCALLGECTAFSVCTADENPISINQHASSENKSIVSGWLFSTLLFYTEFRRCAPTTGLLPLNSLVRVCVFVGCEFVGWYMSTYIVIIFSLLLFRKKKHFPSLNIWSHLLCDDPVTGTGGKKERINRIQYYSREWNTTAREMWTMETSKKKNYWGPKE